MKTWKLVRSLETRQQKKREEVKNKEIGEDVKCFFSLFFSFGLV